jgi:hypothetical protein
MGFVLFPESISDHARFQVLTTANTKMNVFWVVVPCSPVEVYRRFRGDCCVHHQDDEFSSR